MKTFYLEIDKLSTKKVSDVKKQKKTVELKIE